MWPPGRASSCSLCAVSRSCEQAARRDARPRESVAAELHRLEEPAVGVLPDVAGAEYIVQERDAHLLKAAAARASSSQGGAGEQLEQALFVERMIYRANPGSYLLVAGLSLPAMAVGVARHLLSTGSVAGVLAGVPELNLLAVMHVEKKDPLPLLQRSLGAIEALCGRQPDHLDTLCFCLATVAGASATALCAWLTSCRVQRFAGPGGWRLVLAAPVSRARNPRLRQPR